MKQDKEWDGMIYRTEISRETYPELFDALSKINARERLPRLKLLATLGLMALRGQSSFVNTSQIVSETPGNSTVDANDELIHASRQTLKGSLLAR